MKARRLTRDLAACVAFAILWVAPAVAGLARKDLDAIGVDPPPNAALPLDEPLRDDAERRTTLRVELRGKPGVIVFVDYACRTLCSPILALAASAATESGLTPGADYRFIAIGFNPRNSASESRGMADAQIDPASPLGATERLLRADAAGARAMTQAVGYRFIYDAEHDQYAHPAAVLVVRGDGRLSRVLSGLALKPDDLRLALVGAADGAVGSLSDRLHLLCYGFEAGIGFYTDRIRMLLAAAGALTLVALGFGVWRLARHKPHWAGPP